LCQEPSNFRSEGKLDAFLRAHKVPGLCGIDTRALTRIIRESGPQNAMISSEPALSGEQRSRLKAYKTAGALGAVREKGQFVALETGVDKKGIHIAMWDFGDSVSSAQTVLEPVFAGGKMFIHTATAEEILSSDPNGVVLSDGPGDPAENTRVIEEIKKLCDKKIPIFAIGLGHQMLALARGAKVEKMRLGHRGTNQPVRELETGRAFVTKQNHGYAVLGDSLPASAEVSYVNINDGSCEGIEYKDIPAFSVQFHPPVEAHERLLGKFTQLMSDSNPGIVFGFSAEGISDKEGGRG
jgi:carbamoyl-phosphate synthase small subunit